MFRRKKCVRAEIQVELISLHCPSFVATHIALQWMRGKKNVGCTRAMPVPKEYSANPLTKVNEKFPPFKATLVVSSSAPSVSYISSSASAARVHYESKMMDLKVYSVPSETALDKGKDVAKVGKLIASEEIDIGALASEDGDHRMTRIIPIQKKFLPSSPSSSSPSASVTDCELRMRIFTKILREVSDENPATAATDMTEITHGEVDIDDDAREVEEEWNKNSIPPPAVAAASSSSASVPAVSTPPAAPASVSSPSLLVPVSSSSFSSSSSQKQAYPVSSPPYIASSPALLSPPFLAVPVSSPSTPSPSSLSPSELQESVRYRLQSIDTLIANFYALRIRSILSSPSNSAASSPLSASSPLNSSVSSNQSDRERELQSALTQIDKSLQELRSTCMRDLIPLSEQSTHWIKEYQRISIEFSKLAAEDKSKGLSIQQLESDLAKEKTQVKTLNDSTARLEKQVAVLTEENDGLHSQITELEERLSRNSGEESQEMRRMSEEMDSLRSALTAAQGALEGERARLKRNVDAETQRADGLAEKLREERAKHSQTAASNAEKMRVAQAEKQAALVQLQQMQAEKQAWEQSKAEDAAAMQRIIQEATVSLEQQKAVIESELKQLEEQVRAMQSAKQAQLLEVEEAWKQFRSEKERGLIDELSKSKRDTVKLDRPKLLQMEIELADLRREKEENRRSYANEKDLLEEEMKSLKEENELKLKKAQEAAKEEAEAERLKQEKMYQDSLVQKEKEAKIQQLSLDLHRILDPFIVLASSASASASSPSSSSLSSFSASACVVLLNDLIDLYSPFIASSPSSSIYFDMIVSTVSFVFDGITNTVNPGSSPSWSSLTPKLITFTSIISACRHWINSNSTYAEPDLGEEDEEDEDFDEEEEIQCRLSTLNEMIPLHRPASSPSASSSFESHDQFVRSLFTFISSLVEENSKQEQQQQQQTKEDSTAKQSKLKLSSFVQRVMDLARNSCHAVIAASLFSYFTSSLDHEVLHALFSSAPDLMNASKMMKPVVRLVDSFLTSLQQPLICNSSSSPSASAKQQESLQLGHILIERIMTEVARRVSHLVLAALTGHVAPKEAPSLEYCPLDFTLCCSVKMSLSSLEEFFTSKGLRECRRMLSPAKQGCDVLLLPDKQSLVDEAVRRDVCPCLSTAALSSLLESFLSRQSEEEEPMPASAVENVRQAEPRFVAPPARSSNDSVMSEWNDNSMLDIGYPYKRVDSIELPEGFTPFAIVPHLSDILDKPLSKE